MRFPNMETKKQHPFKLRGSTNAKYQLQMDEQSHVPGRSIARSVLLEGIEQGERFARETLLVRMAANHRLLKGPPNPLSHRQTSRVNKRRIKQRILALLLKILSQA